MGLAFLHSASHCHTPPHGRDLHASSWHTHPCPSPCNCHPLALKTEQSQGCPQHPRTYGQDPLTLPPPGPSGRHPSLLKSLWTTLQMAGTTAPTPPPHAPTRMGSSPGWNHLLASRGTRGGGGRCGVSIGDRTILFFHHPLPCIPTPSPALPSRHFSSPFPTSMKLLRGTLSLFRRRGTQVPAGRDTCLPTLGSLENSKGYIQLVMANNPGSSMTEGLLEVHPDLDVAVITCVR